uniref:HAT C-terminal dimerisation domain-containing protein n=1 Tax=Crocodylus porosus TaxID=8502 RepID=A0A7M4G0N4_CROPO
MLLEPQVLDKASKCLLHRYPADLSENFPCEMLHLTKIFKSTFGKEYELPTFILLNESYKKQLQLIFSEVCIAIQVFCILPVTVAEAERSISKLALIKNCRHSTVEQEQLSHLAILSIKCELAREIDFREIIHDFAKKKARKIKL